MEIVKNMVVIVGDSYYSQPAQTGGANGVRVDLVVLSTNSGATQVDIDIETSDDLQNWNTTSLANGTASNFPEHVTVENDATTPNSAKYVRLKVTVTGTSARACVTASISFFTLA